jgi:hypothetical protein
MEATRSSETSVLTRHTRILHSHRCEDLKPYTSHLIKTSTHGGVLWDIDALEAGPCPETSVLTRPTRILHSHLCEDLKPYASHLIKTSTHGGVLWDVDALQAGFGTSRRRRKAPVLHFLAGTNNATTMK